jgi:hypothetical protein
MGGPLCGWESEPGTGQDASECLVLMECGRGMTVAHKEADKEG